MAAHRVSEHGSYRTDLSFRKLGRTRRERRIQKATGARTLAEHNKRVAMLRHLYEKGRLELLRAIRDDRLSIPEVYDAHLTDRIPTLASDIALHRRLTDAATDWLPKSARAENTRKRYECSWLAFQRAKVLPDDAVVADLATVDWEAVQARWVGGATDWNHLRRMISRFLSMLLGDKWHPFRRGVMARIPREDEGEGRVPDLSPEQFWKVVEQEPDPDLQAAFVAILATGFRVGEFCALVETDLRPILHGVRAPGRKRSGRFKSQESVEPVDKRLWKWVRRAIPCKITHWALRRHWRDACDRAGVTDVRLHDLRHCYGQWLTNEGRPEAAIQSGLRHKTASMTRRYTKQRDRQTNAEALGDVLIRSLSSRRSRQQKAGRKGA